jgi:hypothetical protein
MHLFVESRSSLCHLCNWKAFYSINLFIQLLYFLNRLDNNWIIFKKIQILKKKSAKKKEKLCQFDLEFESRSMGLDF